MVDVVVIGGGPAGLTAALYTARRSLQTLVVTKDIGGQAATTSVIENYPGVGAIDGFELMQKFRQQAEQFGAVITLAEVQAITPKPEGGFIVQYSHQTVETHSIILAFGLTPRSLNIPGEADYIGRGVTYSTAAVLEQLRGKRVAVIGGGNSALESVNVLAGLAQQVYIVHRRNQFRAEAVLVDKLVQHHNIEQVLEAAPVRLAGDGQQLKSLTVQLLKDKTERTLEVDAVCVNVGFMSKVDFIKNLITLNEKREVLIQPDCTTSLPGIFAAGDITQVNYKQVVVSAGEGCKAALACFAYLMKQRGQTVEVDQDWQVKTGEHYIRT